jgi:hypothetical protein
MHTTTTSDRYPVTTPDATGDSGEPDDARQLSPDVDDRDPEEAGYGYGV